MSSILRTLAVESGLSHPDLLRVIATAPARYKVFTIPKRSGGEREIAQPAREVKALQRILVSEILSYLPIHDAAAAYRVGRSIRDNAAAHAGQGPILKMDFRDFFPSIRSEDWESYAQKQTNLSNDDIRICSQIFFRRRPKERILRLSIGAPSSPILSNILLYEFDEIVSNEARRRQISYTRYADDMTFSGQRIGMLKDMFQVVQMASKKSDGPRLSINEDKTVYATTAVRRTVTGVVLANSGALSLGHERKRLMSAKVHYAKQGKLDKEALEALAGELAFAKVVEPDFLLRLAEKYGHDTILLIQKSARVNKPKKAPPLPDVF